MKKKVVTALGLTSIISPFFNAVTVSAHNIEDSSISPISYSTNKNGTVVNIASWDTLNVRNKASNSGDILFKLKPNTVVTVLDKTDDWYKISYNGTVGYCYSKYIEISTEPSVEVQSINKNGKVVNVASNDVLNARELPNGDAKLLFTIPPNAGVHVIEKTSNNWYKISYYSKEAYVNARYIELLKDTVQDSVTEPENITALNKDGKVIKVAYNDTLNVRESSNSDSKVLFTLKNDTLVKIIGQASNGWYKINYNGKTGFASNHYIEIVDIQTQYEKYITTMDLNLRKTASWSGEQFAIIKSNTIVEVMEIEGSWAKVKYENTFGYLPLSYLKQGNDSDSNNSTSTPTPTPNPTPDTPAETKYQIATVNTNGLNIRAGASTSYSVISQSHKGDTVKLLDKNTNGWYKVELVNGVIGWCNGTYLENIREGYLPESNPDIKETIQEVIKVAKAQIGKPYSYGSSGPNSFDCSGLTLYAYQNGAGITLPRNSKSQATAGKYVSKSELQVGDLVFFNTSGSGISHVGIYLGNNEMVHAPSSGKSVSIANMDLSYWSSRYVTARRILY